ncbi:MAG: hypothetical protein JNK53_00785 [Phycisphaerae bacterium]|nr:hypothetical protein [Phycisphaerae bacterium]
MANRTPTVLVTAFEPSGDAHAAPLVAALRQAAPEVRVVGWGGPRMRAAGCEMVGETARDGTMALGSFAKILSTRRTVHAIREWASGQHIDVHVPVDSPAANWHIAWWMKQRRGAAVVNLVAPQLWAWAPWRIRKWRRTSDAILCLLPFEEEWFRSRGVRAHFVGHPVLSAPIGDDVRARAARYPAMAPNEAPQSRKLLLLPGSRSNEVRDNMHHMLRIYAVVARTRPDVVGLVMAANEGLVPLVREAQAKAGLAEWPRGLSVASADAEGAIAWCDAALNVSGTVSLDLAHQRKPMVAVYWTGWIGVVGARIMLRTPHRLLPNIVAGRRIVPEFIPIRGGEEPVAHEVARMLDDAALRTQMAGELDAVARRFEGHDPGRESASVVLELLRARGGAGDGADGTRQL